MNRAARRYALAFLTALALPVSAAPGWPTKPVRLVSPFPAGGSSDIIARIVAHRLGERLGQQFIVDNRAGAGGILGGELVARASPDGYTLIMANTAPTAISPNLYKRVPYDQLRDFTAISQLAVGPSVLLVHPALPAKTLRELIALAKSKPGSINYGSGGSGSTSHLSAELFRLATGIDLVHVPYKGTGIAVGALLANEVQMVFAPMPVAMPHVKSGKLRALGITSAKRSAQAPELPTLEEAGAPGVVLDSWWGMLAPAKVAPAIIERLNRELQAILALPEVRERFAELGVEPVGGTPAEFNRFVRDEFLRYGKLLKNLGLQAE
jgi:tripartite-type tricarboxylate transporter receptor subunit TctC